MANKTKSSNIVVGLDIGTSKVVCIVGKFVEDNLEIIALGAYPSSGLKKGVVGNVVDMPVNIVVGPTTTQGIEHRKVRSWGRRCSLSHAQPRQALSLIHI